MPKVEIEICRTVEVTRDENAIVELDVPKRVIDGEVLSWLDEIMEKGDESMTAKEKAIHAAMTGAEWEASDEDEVIEYTEAFIVE